MTRKIETVVTFLEMTKHPTQIHPIMPAMPTAVMRAEHPPVHFYRYLYDQIGREFNWSIRRKMTDTELEDILNTDTLRLYVLYVEGVPMGMGELDFADMPDVQLAYFGLMKEARGKGLGPYFLHHVLEIAWAEGPHRILVNTCTLDHPRALPLYQRMGFEAYNQETDYLEAIED